MFKLEEGWLTVLLLCAMMIVAAGGVAAAGWTDGLNAAWITGIFAIFAGLALARSRFSRGNAFLFATLFALLFGARMNLLTREREWQSARASYSPDLRLDFLRAGLAAALAGVIIAWAAPSLAASPQAAPSWRQMTGSLSVVRESWMRMFAP